MAAWRFRMAKPDMVCPFSKKLCIECAQFRGRHYHFCFAPKYRGFSWDRSKVPASKAGGGKRDNGIEKPPIIPISSKWLTNLEDCIDRREG
jgi:hypothetical protein